MAITYTWRSPIAHGDIEGNVIEWTFGLDGEEDGLQSSYSISIGPNQITETYTTDEDGNKVVVTDPIVFEVKPVADYTNEEITSLRDAVGEHFGWHESIRTYINSRKAEAERTHIIDI